MKTTTKIVFASALTLSAIAPTFVHAAYLQNASSNPCDERACAKCNGQECSCGPRARTPWPMYQPTSATGTHATLE